MMDGGTPRPDPNEPYPSVRGALMLTLLAILAAGFTGIAFIDFGLLAAVGIGQAIGVGAVATFGAQRVPEPQAERLGLRALDWEAVPMILCLVPAILLASELDNVAADLTTGSSGGAGASRIELDEASDARDGSSATGWQDEADASARSSVEDPTVGIDSPPASQPATGGATADGAPSDVEPTDPTRDDDAIAGDEAGPTAERLIDLDDPASVLQAFVVMVGISPIVEEFLFRGVIQQGLVQRLGFLRGVSMVALLWTLLRPAPIAGFGRFLAAALASFGLGVLLGLVRIATRSILAPILLASSWAAVGLTSMVLTDEIDLPGMNVEGSHLPITVTLASLAIVGWAGWAFYQEAEEVERRDRGTRPPRRHHSPSWTE